MTTQTTEVGKINVTCRTRKGKTQARVLRRQGVVPAVVYGQGHESLSVTLKPEDLHAALDPGKRRNTLLTLTLRDEQGGNQEQMLAMLKDVQIDSLKQTLLHVDFVRVSLEKRVHAAVPLVAMGKPEGLKFGGVLHQVFRQLDVVCTPDKIPTSLSADVTALNIGDTITIGQLALPDGVQVAVGKNLTCIQVVTPRKEVEPVAAEAEGAEGEAVAEAGATAAAEGATPEKAGGKAGADKGGKAGADKGGKAGADKGGKAGADKGGKKN
jgi:large subunit ribosomal protein L25